MSNRKIYRIKLTEEERETLAQVAKGKRGKLNIAAWKVQRANCWKAKRLHQSGSKKKEPKTNQPAAPKEPPHDYHYNHSRPAPHRPTDTHSGAQINRGGYTVPQTQQKPDRGGTSAPQGKEK